MAPSTASLSGLRTSDAVELDSTDPCTCLRDHFWIPTPGQLDSDRVSSAPNATNVDQETAYLCGNSLGLQPKATTAYVNAQMQLWQAKGVYGHFKKTDSIVPPWVDCDEAVQQPMARIVGALPSEIAVMQTLSANLHILLSCFYKPTASRYKIILEAKSFPSDHFVVESQLRHHSVNAPDGMVLLHPPSKDSPCLPTDYILKTIDEHASSTALVLLPGIQFYTGQYFDIARITAHAHEKGIVIGWDLAHAVGNVPLALHDWNVDFAAWCTYKYMNAGPGSIGALFVHSKHTDIPTPTESNNSTLAGGEAEHVEQRPRLQGWWGSSKVSRFAMENKFEASPGAAGFQLSNPSVLDMTSLMGSLSVFEKTSMNDLRAKSIRLTAYLEALLLESSASTATDGDHKGAEVQGGKPYKIITPHQPEQRGAQLSVQLQPGLLNHVVEVLEKDHVVVDERKPDVIRVAPAPLYNNFRDCRRFYEVFDRACNEAMALRNKERKPGQEV